MPAASVVLVEDAIPYARLVELILADAVPGGVEVRHHERVGSAVVDLREREADCVLLDLGLPDANGLEAVAQVIAVAGGVPVIVLSGHDDDELAVAAIRAGAQDYLVKGQEVPPRRFIRAIRFAIERRRAQERNEDLLRAKEDRWRTLTHLAPVGILEIDEGGRCVFANDWVSEITGREPGELLGVGWQEAFGQDAAALFDPEVDDVGGEVRFERDGGAGGGVRWAQLTGVLLRDPWGGPAGWLATLVDVTPAREARAALRRQQDDVLALAALARDASVAEEPVDVLLHGARGVLGAADVAYVQDGGLDDGERVVERRVLRGEIELGVLRVTWPDDDVLGRPLLAVELLAAELGAALERRRLLEQLRALARTDPLTGLANRRLWDERLSVELARAERYGGPLCVAAIDLDRFKPYNDRFGHAAGDTLLRDATHAWRGVLRGSDLLSRLGGDEFAVLLPDCDLDCAQAIVSRLQGVTPGGEEGVGSSAGLVEWRAGEDAAAVVARADAALYTAKGAGRGGISVG
ncbi:diguanylate cyclase domain-containing protein [Baekduia sp. Peel2402]|uniref:diguanylate cyclase domain-containing protein n=1 Tax=Baekduia sp. Peel2402 TaxID=3458296 RepID=UPI00403ED34C